jgi:hypothetical protein
MNNSAIRAELLNMHTYLKYLLDTIDNLLKEIPTEHIYQAALLSKCLNLEEILFTFQNQFINNREKFNLALDKALKELNNDVDTKIQTISSENSNTNEESKNINIINYVNALNNDLVIIKEDLQKKFEITENAIISHGMEIHEMKKYIQQDLIPAVIRLNSLLPQEPVSESTSTQIKEQVPFIEIPLESLLDKNFFDEQPEQIESDIQYDIESTSTNKKIPKWFVHIDEVKRKMKEKKWNEHEVSEFAKINFNSFRKFQKKDPKLTNGVVNKILKLFDITY